MATTPHAPVTTETSKMVSPVAIMVKPKSACRKELQNAQCIEPQATMYQAEDNQCPSKNVSLPCHSGGECLPSAYRPAFGGTVWQKTATHKYRQKYWQKDKRNGKAVGKGLSGGSGKVQAENCAIKPSRRPSTKACAAAAEVILDEFSAIRLKAKAMVMTRAK